MRRMKSFQFAISKNQFLAELSPILLKAASSACITDERVLDLSRLSATQMSVATAVLAEDFAEVTVACELKDEPPSSQGRQFVIDMRLSCSHGELGQARLHFVERKRGLTQDDIKLGLL